MIIHPSFFHSEPHWPPQPHPLTGLSLSSQEEWGINEWKMYAEILEDAGYYLLEALMNTDEKLSKSEEKKSRAKKQPTQTPAIEILLGRTLLTSATLYKPTQPKPKPKRGRKHNNAPNNRKELAQAAITKRAELEATGNYVKDKDALAAVYAERGMGKWRASSSRHVINEMSAIRTKTNTSIRSHKK